MKFAPDLMDTSRALLFSGRRCFMGRQREFKVEAVRPALTTKGPVSAVARVLGVRPEMLRAWKRRVEAQGGAIGCAVFHGQGCGRDMRRSLGTKSQVP